MTDLQKLTIECINNRINEILGILENPDYYIYIQDYTSGKIGIIFNGYQIALCENYEEIESYIDFWINIERNK